ncbi:MAG TPA: hypothetical protein DCQ31_10025, partial [Bacteroidales bacterium]|nr:hypothetical protein [Bacteroidales bacterium]
MIYLIFEMHLNVKIGKILKTIGKIEFQQLTIFLLAGIIFFAIVYLCSYVDNEGFNPSDEGVILAQSFRIYNGELPHKDFISTKPVVSSYLHTIHFFSGLPLVISSRYFVLLQIFIISAFWFWTVFFSFVYSGRTVTYNSAFLLFVFLVLCFANVNNFFLFPWTTIDAL